MGRYTDVQPFTCKVICGKCGTVCWRRTWTRGRRKIRAGQMVQLTAEPPLETICPEIVNMVLESVEVHDGGLLHFHFLDGTVLEIDTEE